MRRPCRAALLALAALAAAAAEAGATAAPAAPSVLLVTLDTTRADRLGAYGYGAAQTPTLDRLARSGIVFERAVAPTPITLPSHATILTGTLPPAHGVRDNAVFALGPEAVLVSEALRAHGYRTGAFVGSMILDGMQGLDQGFETYRAPGLADKRLGQVVARPANEVVSDALSWLAGVEPGERFFAWVHLYDPHFPYEPPAPWSERLADPYDGEIAFCDSQLARLLQRMAARGLDADLLVVVTADHGESLGEHGERTHGVYVYRSTLHVPLILAGAPVAERGGRRVDRPVSLDALAATILRVAGVPRDAMPRAAARDLLAAEAAEHPIYVESELPFHSHGWRALRGIEWGGYKLVDGAEPELYALAADPAETRDVSGAEPQRVARLRERLQALLAAQPDLGWTRRRKADGGERELLAALGYVIGDARGDPYADALPDPRAYLPDHERIERARQWIADRHVLHRRPAPATAWERAQREAEERRLLVSARDLLREVLSRNPDDTNAMEPLAVAEHLLGENERAIALLEELVRRRPRQVHNRINLAVNYERVGREEDAERELREALRIEPRNPAPYRWFVRRHESRGEWKRAAEWQRKLVRALEGDPEADAARERLRTFETLARNAATGAPP